MLRKNRRLSAKEEAERKNYCCGGCSRWYKYLHNLRSHQKYECGKPPLFVCTYDGCNFKSKKKGNLKQHIFNKHGIDLVG